MAKSVQNPRVAEALHQEYDLVGRVRPLIDEVIVPTVLVGDLRQPTATVARSASAFLQVAAGGAGTFTIVRFETPPGIIARVEAIRINPGANTDINVHWGSSVAAPTQFGTKTFTDGRLRVQNQTPAAVLAGDNTYVAALAAFEWKEPLTPGASGKAMQLPPFQIGDNVDFDFVEFQLAVANTLVQFSMYWTEFFNS